MMTDQSKERCILFSGFDPFYDQPINPSWLAVSSLPDTIGGYHVHKLLIPTVFTKGANTVLQAAKSCHPDFIFMVGQAGGAASVTPELIGYNLRNARIPDNEGNQIRNQPILPDGPMCLCTRLPLVQIVATMKHEGYNINISSYAGAFVCNDVFYSILSAFKDTSTKADFIHVPFLPEQAAGEYPSMSLESITKTLLRFIELAIQQ